jgi:very-short-patch-repair endonuclease
VNLDFGSDDIEDTHSLVTSTIKRCQNCGYGKIATDRSTDDNCDRCGQFIDAEGKIDRLVVLQNCTLKPVQRITCDEEERQRYGYNMVTSYRFPESGGQQDRQDCDVFVNDQLAMQLSYGDATDLYRINLGWLRQKQTEQRGFVLDIEKGFWGRNEQDSEDEDDAVASRVKRVVPYVHDTKNALVIRFSASLNKEQMAALQAAFKEAIQKEFQLEPRELSSEPLPSRDVRNELLFYEAAEGGAGVLRQLVTDRQLISTLARRALQICHFDPITLEDLRPDKCGKACYECLLDYFNQPDHSSLDRNSIRDLLGQLANAEARPAGGVGSRTDRLAELLERCDSELEKRWLRFLDQHMLRLPSQAQHLLAKAGTRPDFFYAEEQAAVYIDGPIHDKPDQIRRDEEVGEQLQNYGYSEIRFRHDQDWMQIVKTHQRIFGEPRE